MTEENVEVASTLPPPSEAAVADEGLPPYRLPLAKVSGEDLLGLDVVAEAMALRDLTRESLNNHGTPPSLQAAGTIVMLDRRQADLLVEIAARAARFADAFLLQTEDRLPRDETTATVVMEQAFLLRAVVRRADAGRICVVLAGGNYDVGDVVARALILRGGILLIPGVPLKVEPADAILLGRRLTPAEALQWWSRPVSERVVADAGTASLMSAVAAGLGEKR